MVKLVQFSEAGFETLHFYKKTAENTTVENTTKFTLYKNRAERFRWKEDFKNNPIHNKTV